MATVRCKKCGREISDTAKHCPYCGTATERSIRPASVPNQQPNQPLKQAPQRSPYQAPQPPEKKSRAPVIIALCAAIIVVAAAAVVLVLHASGERNADRVAEEETTEEETTEKETTKAEKTTEAAASSAFPAESSAAAGVTAAGESAADALTTAAQGAIQASPLPDASAQAQQPAAGQQVPAYQTTLYVVNCSEYITLRQSPSTAAAALRQIPLGSAVSFVGNAADGFYQVIYNGTTGYALAQYLSASQSSGTPQANAAPVYQTMRVVNCQQFITLRAAPSTTAAEITKIPLGSVVSFVANSTDGFYEILYNGNHGFALASYLEAN